MAENEVRRDLATWPVSVDKRLDQNAEWIGDLTRRVTKLETVPYADMVAASKLDALAARVSALETASAKCPSAPMPHEAAPSPAAALVERMAEAIHKTMCAGGIFEQDVPTHCARAALRVAAEGLLGSVTDEEWAAAIAEHFSYQDCCSAILRARLARAKEAARG